MSQLKKEIAIVLIRNDELLFAALHYYYYVVFAWMINQEKEA